MATKKLIYFTAGITPTATEVTEMATLNSLTSPGYQVVIRNGSQEGKGSLESADLVAGTIPTAYSGYTSYGSVSASRPTAFKVFPATVSLAAAGTAQLYPVKAGGLTVSDISLSQVSSGVSYASSNATKASVNASTGLITGVAAGTATITATYTYTTGKTVTSTVAVTVS